MTRIALGAAQFGMGYGVANENGQPSLYEVEQVLNTARLNGVGFIDTAKAYGDSEEILGSFNLDTFEVGTKIHLNNSEEVTEYLLKGIKDSCKKLNKDRLNCVLLHDINDLKRADAKIVVDSLVELKETGLVKSVGVSIYAPNDLDLVFSLFVPDIIQGPYNLLDKRLKYSGWLRKIKELGVEFHARSVFLQGLLILEKDARPIYFRKWENALENIDRLAKKNGLTKQELALGFVLKEKDVDRLIMGVDSEEQLSQLLKIEKKMSDLEINFTDINNTNDLDLIEPRRWQLK